MTTRVPDLSMPASSSTSGTLGDVLIRAFEVAVRANPETGLSVPLTAILLYGLCKVMSKAFADVRDSVFVPVTQNALQMSGLDTFSHLHNLSHSFHVGRRTGGVLRYVYL